MTLFPEYLPVSGKAEEEVFAFFQKQITTRSARLDSPLALAHMDPPTPDIAAKLVGLNARFNQNLLHPDLSPFATEAERTVIAWLAPVFGMTSGHMCGGSTLANLTALWCARENGASSVVASVDAHISVEKSAHILGLRYTELPIDDEGRMIIEPSLDIEKAALVLTAGTTGRGVIDPLGQYDACWTHVDAAWAGPLRLSKHAHLLNGVEAADSIAISAHKWFYQPKESALVLFRNPTAEEAVSYGGAYLATPNVGVQGSRGAAAIPLLATLMAWGQLGLAARIEKNMADAKLLANMIDNSSRLLLRQHPETAVFNWQPLQGDIEALLKRLGETASRTVIDEEVWVRQVAVNPQVDIKRVWQCIEQSI